MAGGDQRRPEVLLPVYHPEVPWNWQAPGGVGPVGRPWDLRGNLLGLARPGPRPGVVGQEGTPAEQEGVLAEQAGVAGQVYGIVERLDDTDKYLITCLRETCIGSLLYMTALMEYNSALARQEVPDVSSSLWDSWLWFLDAREELSSRILLNESHLTGLILCRVCAMQVHVEPEMDSLCGTTALDMHRISAEYIGNFALDQKQYSQLSMREVKNHVVQTQMHLYDICGTGSTQKTHAHVAALFTRVGQLLQYSATEEECMYDDLDGLKPELTEAVHTRVFSETGVRWFMNVFYVLFRNLHLHHTAKAPVPREEMVELQVFHVEATLDTFYELTMRWDLPPAAVLCYQHEFVGMFNSISQVVYYNYADYERRRQLDWKVVATGEHAIYSLAPVLSLFPEVTLVHEDEPLHFVPGSKHGQGAQGGWRMLLTPGFLYLLSDTGEVFHHENVCELLRVVPGRLKK